MSVYRDILVKLGSNIVTWAASGNENDKNTDRVKEIKSTEIINTDAGSEAETEEITTDIATDIAETTTEEYIEPDRELSPEEMESAESKAESERVEMEEKERASENQETTKSKKKNKKSVTKDTKETTTQKIEESKKLYITMVMGKMNWREHLYHQTGLR